MDALICYKQTCKVVSLNLAHPVVYGRRVTVMMCNVTVIEEGNWLTLVDDVKRFNEAAQFDAVLCLGNSFAHLPDFHGDLLSQRRALQNFKALLKPQGILVIDHRNYDEILNSGEVPAKNIYYNVSSSFITSSARQHKALCLARCYRLSIRLSVRLSVRLSHGHTGGSVKTVEVRIMKCLPYGSPIHPFVFAGKLYSKKISSRNSNGLPSIGGVKREWVGKQAIFWV